MAMAMAMDSIYVYLVRQAVESVMPIRFLFCEFTVHTLIYLDPIDSVDDTPLTTTTLQSIVTRLKHLMQ